MLISGCVQNFRTILTRWMY